MKKYLIFILPLISFFGFSQNDSIQQILPFNEYLGYVKAFHPIVKQSELVITQSQAQLMKARGAFDPKVSIDYDRKKFSGTEYFDKLNGMFKIPTWFGVELKATFEENTGQYLNPEAFVPQDGSYAAGIKVPLAQGLLINNRMAALKQAKLFKNQAKAERDILVNTILYQASIAYFNWLKAYNELVLYQNFLANTQQRFNGVKRGAEVGENAQIDVVEARIAVNQRQLGLEQSKVKLMKAALELSTYLWLQGSIPVELQPNIIPDVNAESSIDASLSVNELQTNTNSLAAHPKLVSLDYKLQSLEVDKRLKMNKLLPKFDVEYNFITQTPELANSLNTANYKGGFNLSVPLFLRKERADLKLAKLKLQDLTFERNATQVTLQNKINALRQEMESYTTQNSITAQMVSDYEKMLKAEERKFQLGESSLFLVNSRESKLIDGQLKAIELQYKFFSTKAKLFKAMALNPEF